jgi:serine protease Do
MKRSSIGAAALLALASLPASADEDHDIYIQVRPSLVQLVGAGIDGRYSLGSGVALPDGSIVTSCHVTMRAKRVEPFWGGGSAKAQAQRADVLHDLCTLHVPGLSLSPVEVGRSRDLHVGDKVYAVGFNRGRSLTYESGEVAELSEFDGGMVIRTTAAFSQGASGGGLFDERGRLVGILTFFRVGGEIAYFAVPVEWLQAVAQLPSADVQPLQGVPFWADSLERQPAFLQAGALEAGGRWEELAAFARHWTEARPGDASAWLMLGKAALNTGDSATASAAFERAAQGGTIYAADPHPSVGSSVR